jgi:hypothetical protein
MLTVASWNMNQRLVAWRRLRDLTRESGASIVLLQEARLTRVQTATARAGTSRPTHPSAPLAGRERTHPRRAEAIPARHGAALATSFRRNGRRE